MKVININSDKRHEILDKCKVMREYSQFMEQVRIYREQGKGNALEEAIRYCIHNHILEEYLKRKGREVMGFLCAEYDYDLDIKVQRQEAYEDGLEIGEKRGIEKGEKKGIEIGEKKGIEIGEKKGIEIGLEKGIEALILDNLEENKSLEEISNKLQKRFSIDQGKADAYIKKYTNA